MQISINEVKPGMRLEKAVTTPDGGKVLLAADTTLTLRNIDKLKEMKVAEVEIADRYTLFISPNDKIAEALIWDFKTFLRKTCPPRPEANKNDNVVKIARQLSAIIDKIAQNDTILSLLMQEKIVNNRYLYECGVRSAVLSGIVAGCMNLSIQDIVYCISGALLHDIGMCEMPFLIGADNLSGQQEELYKQHPTYGYYFAVQQNISRNVSDCIQYHHERWDGSGYPKGLKGEEIPIISRIVKVCSDYITQINYKKVPPYMAVEALYGGSGIYYDYNVVQAFVNNIPIYPLGGVVKLSTKEVGIVSNIRKNDGPRPVVKIYYNRVNRPITEDKIVDLGKERTIFIEEVL
ncbi:MAG: HD-GYP domain-containing protein [Butyrivibrio sp.]